MRRALVAGAFVIIVFDARGVTSAPPPPPVVAIGADRFDISGEGNSVTGVRHAPVPFDSMEAITAAIAKPVSLPAAVRLVRSAPPQVIDYVLCVAEDGALLVGQQVRTLDMRSGLYVFTDGDIKRAYRALEATVPWTWIVDIPLGRELDLILELRAMTATWPIRAVAITPRLGR